jgi:hypothetical protein
VHQLAPLFPFAGPLATLDRPIEQFPIGDNGQGRPDRNAWNRRSRSSDLFAEHGCRYPCPAKMPSPSRPLAFSGLVVFALLKRVEIHEFRQKIKGPFHPHGPFAQDDFIAGLFGL